jgi:hypothetical protein
MRRTILPVFGLLILAVGWTDGPPRAAGQVPFNVVSGDGPMEPDGPRFPNFQMVTRGAKVHDGFFKLYEKDDRLYLELPPEKLNRPFLCPIAIARGAGLGGETLNADEQWVLLFKRVGDKIQLVRRNVHFRAKAGSPTARAVETTYSDSVLMAVRIATINPMHMAPLINLNDILMTDFAELGLGMFDANRSSWGKIKTFPRNVELEVNATYAGRQFGDDNIDHRGTSVVIHYGLAELAESGYQPRVADDRVGYFISAVKDFSSESKDTAFVRYVNRWRLDRAEPADPKHPNKLSVPTKSIKYYIEKTVPHEYRAAVQEGILEWNKAFEKVGFRNAIEVVQQRDDEDWDPEDMNYNTIRWITRDEGFAMGPSRANPMTGEILDADIIFDADLIRFWKWRSMTVRGGQSSLEPVSPIQAMDQGWGLDQLMPRRPAADSWNETPRRRADDPNAAHLWAIRQGLCQCGSRMQFELGMAAMTLAARGDGKPGDKVPDELINQAVKSIIMHEVGHTLGLRHNFKGSTMLPNDQLHDTKITHEKGLIGSVMDYAPVNLAPKGVKQGDYFTTTLGPYDYWAIEYAYKPGADAAELQKIAARCGQPGLDYATDEDTFLAADPLVNRWDLGADTMKFAQDRMLLSEEMLKTLSTKVVDEGEGYQRARVAFGMLLKEYGDGAYLVSKFIGGEHVYRDHRGDAKGRDPLVPVPAAKQREALKFLQENVFSDKTYQVSPEVLRRLAVDRWFHWGASTAMTDFPLYDRVLGIQRVALAHMFDPAVLRRIQANALKADKDEKPLTIAEVFRSATDGIWNDLPNGGQKDDKPVSSVMRRNLQREYIAQLSGLVLGKKGGGTFSFGGLVMIGGPAAVPPDARSLARMHLRDVSTRVDAALNDKRATPDETTVAHLEECRERIAKVLSASMQVNE